MSRSQAKADKKLVDRAFDHLCGIVNKSGMDALTLPQRAVVLPLWSNGWIMNGGFRYWFEGAFWKDGRDLTPLLIEAFAFLGFKEAAQACRDAMKFFPAEALEVGPSKTNAWMARFTEDQIAERLDPLSRVLWATEHEDWLTVAVAKVIREYKLDG